MKSYILFLVFALASIVKAQTISVIDKTTREGISGVIVYHPKSGKSETSNTKGLAKIPNPVNYDSLGFRLTGYKSQFLSKSKIESLNFIVELQESSFVLGEIAVSANRWEENKTEIPQKVEIINKKQMEFYNPQTSADLLEISGYAYVQKSQMAGGSPMLRGFATNRVLIVVDGVRMNNAIFRSGNLQNVISIDANALENSEVLFGPGAVMYGSDAIGGVMDFHTLKTRFSDSSGQLLFKTNALARYSSVNSEKTGHLDFTIAGKKWSSLSSISYSDYSDLRTGSNGNVYFLRPSYVKTENGKDSMHVNQDTQRQVGSAFDQLNAIQKIGFKPNESTELDYGFYYSQSSNAGRYDRLTLDNNSDGKLDFSEWYYGPQKWMMNRMTFFHKSESKFYEKLKLTAAIQNFEESRHDRRFNSNTIRHQTEKVNAYSFNADLDKRIHEKLTLFYGMEAVYNTIESEAFRQNTRTSIETPSQTRYPNGSDWQAYGLYANSKYKHNNNWIITAGLRYSYYRIQADFDTAFFPFPFNNAENQAGALNGSLGFVFSPKPSWQLYSSLSTGFRAPNLDDMGKVFESQPGSVVVPNPELKPEYAYNAEIGTVKSFGNFLKIDLAAYYTFLNNAIARRGYSYNGQDSILYDGEMSKVLAMQNITKAYVYGLQAGIDVYFGGGVRIKSTISYQKGEEQDIDSMEYYPKPHVAPLFGATHLMYNRKQLKLDVYAQYNAAMTYNDLPLVDRIDNSIYAKTPDGLPFVPAWYTLNVKLSWFINQNFSFNTGVENITDQLYRNFSSGISAPGRNFSISLRYKL
ncbi:MAG: TonB-dependent receptor [Bacteroidia bacterium]|jgi:hemoglobin/transferrin/lactoferrin receptor protein|nr:TonB-dependent receptor [Bacteroidia bacterium]